MRLRAILHADCENIPISGGRVAIVAEQPQDGGDDPAAVAKPTTITGTSTHQCPTNPTTITEET
jgi:hypothetical protein